jgi:hypothetical protein
MRIALQCAPVCAWYDGDAQTWTTGPGIGPEVSDGTRRRRLLGKTKCFFAIVTLRGSNGARFAAQSLSHPVAARANSPRDAINGLRTALAEWVQEEVAFALAEPQTTEESHAPFPSH